MDLAPIAIFWVLALIGFCGKRSALIYLFFASMPFGSFAVIPPHMTMGLTFTPTPIIALLLIIRTLGSGKAIRFAVSAMTAPRGLLLLTLFWVTAAAVTLLMPRVFEGQVDVVPMNLQIAFFIGKLAPTNQNISQLAYLTISVFTVVAFARIMLDPRQQQHALKALCLGGCIAIFAGILDYASHFIALDWLLAPFRTATYALMTDVKLQGGTRRVVGLMPEASAYGAQCVQLLTLLYFLRNAISDNFLRQKVVPVIGGLLLLFVWMSTSSSAYVALVVLSAFAALEWLWRLKHAHRGTAKGREIEKEFWTGFVFLAVILATCIIRPDVFDPAVKLFNQMVLQKTNTASYIERSLWTRVSWQALWQTYGLGVGMGGTRASNAIVAIFSNTGILGGLFYYCFIGQSLLRRAYPGDVTNATMVSGLRWAFLPIITADILAGTSADFGLRSAFLFGTIFAAAMLSWHTRKSLSAKAGDVSSGTENMREMSAS